jgi:hypothetical protein
MCVVAKNKNPTCRPNPNFKLDILLLYNINENSSESQYQLPRKEAIFFFFFLTELWKKYEANPRRLPFYSLSVIGFNVSFCRTEASKGTNITAKWRSRLIKKLWFNSNLIQVYVVQPIKQQIHLIINRLGFLETYRIFFITLSKRKKKILLLFLAVDIDFRNCFHWCCKAIKYPI